MKSVFNLYRDTDIPIIGVGGVSRSEDAVELMLAGASAVQVGSAVQNGIEVLGEIADGIRRYRENNSYSYDEFVGRTHEVIGD